MRSFDLAALSADPLGDLLLRAAASSGFGVLVVGTGKIHYANGPASVLLGFERLNGATLPLEESAPVETRLLCSRVEQELDPRAWEAKTTRLDGSPGFAEVTSSRFQLDGVPVVVAFLRDVTERRELREQVSRADKLASLGTLAAGVAHEINNPLTFMTLGVGLVATRIQSSRLSAAEKASLGATLAEVRRGAERVADIVRELNSFARVEDERRQLVDLRAIIGRAQRIVAHRARHVALIDIDIPTLPALETDPGRIEQVFVNLLVNAAQALDTGKEGGRISIRGEFTSTNRVAIDVIDNGPGIPPEIIERIFDPFFTTKPVGEGTGLGLSVCHGIVTQLGGSLSVLSVPGETRFRIELPLREAQSTAPPPHSGERLRETARLRVLVIDDEPTVLQAIKRSAQREHDVTTASTGDDALVLLGADRPYDVILCDLAMPGRSGMEVFEAIGRLYPELAARFVIMTGGAPTAKLRKFVEDFKGPILLKPFSLAELSGVLLSVVARAS